MAAVGLKWEGEIRNDTVWVFPKNWPALLVFLAMKTQWRVIASMNGNVYQGLEYASIAPVMEILDIPKRQRADVFTRLQVMESAVLPALNAE